METNTPKIEVAPAVETKVILEFMRHGKREKHPDPALDGGPELLLTPQGRAQATERGKEINPNPEVSLGWGSPRNRTQETSYRVMLANEDIGPDDTLEEIEAKIAEQIPYGKKMIEDQRLDFHGDGPIAAEGVKAYHQGKYMSWVIENSDHDAVKQHDTESSTYTRMAANVAEIILRYTKVGMNFNRIASKSDKYQESGNQLERYLGTHQGISESFVAKVLEKVKGENAKQEFLKSVGGGFSEIQGMRIEIINKNAEDQSIKMSYSVTDPENGEAREETIEFEPNVLEGMIDERGGFEKEVNPDENKPE